MFGGTYIVLYYIGILLENLGVFKRTIREKICIFIATMVLWIVWLAGYYDGKLPFDRWMSAYWGTGLNPPSVNVMIYAIITLFLLYALFEVIQESKVKIIAGIVRILSLMGRYTLYIFMYHLFVRDMLKRYFPHVFTMNRFGVNFLIFILMIALPVMVFYIVKKLKKHI